MVVDHKMVFREKLIKFLTAYKNKNGLKMDIVETVNNMSDDCLHDLGEKFLKTQDEYETMKGGKRKRKTRKNKRNKRKRRKNRTRKVQRGGQFNRFTVINIIVAVASFILGRYGFPNDVMNDVCVPNMYI